MSSEPQMSDAQFTNQFSILLGGLTLLTIALIIGAVLISSGVDQSAINEQARDQQVVERIQPVGQINVGEVASSQAAASGSGNAEATADASGETVYQDTCAACHAGGVAGAPTFGDSAAWSDRLDQGMETLYRHSIEGFQGSAGMMPPKGGNASLSDEEVKAAVDHMVDAVTESGTAESGAAESEAAESEAAESEAAESEAAESEAAESEAAESEAAESEAAESGAAESGAAESGAAESGTAESGAADVASGETVYQNSCMACHASGVAGAPRLGDAGAWSDRLDQGLETLYRHSIEGFQGSSGVMPPKGGNTSLSDAEVKAAVDYMVEQAQ